MKTTSDSFLSLLIRFTACWTLAAWQGGFFLYSAFVIKIGSRELGSDLEQGFITRSVTIVLENLGWLAIVCGAAAMLSTRFGTAAARRTAWAIWGAILAAHAVLHRQWYTIDNLLDFTARSIRDGDAFHVAHRVYAWTASIQFVLCLIISGMVLDAWFRASDAGQAKKLVQSQFPNATVLSVKKVN